MLCAGNVARVLLAGFELIERRPPRSAAELRRWDRALCDAVALVERDAPYALAGIHAAVVARRAARPWWTFRPWQRLSLALRAQAAGVRAVSLLRDRTSVP
jgi:hypothetical protein